MGFLFIFGIWIIASMVYYWKVIKKKWAKDDLLIYQGVCVFLFFMAALIILCTQSLFGYEDWQLAYEISLDNETSVVSNIEEANDFLTYFENSSEGVEHDDFAYETKMNLSRLVLEVSEARKTPLLQIYKKEGVRNFWTFIINETYYKGVLLLPFGTLGTSMESSNLMT